MYLEGKKIRSIFRIVFVFIVLLMLPAYSLEIIQPSYDEVDIDFNKKIFEKYNTGVDNYDGIYIPNPIDLYKEKKSLKETPEKTTPTKLTLDCEKMEYDNDTGELKTVGRVTLRSYPEKTKITADRAVYDKNANIIKFFDNVILYKDNGVIKGDYMVVDLNRENILMNEPVGDFMTFRVTGREGYAYSNQLETINGDIELSQKIEATLASHGFSSNYYDENIVQRDIVNLEMRKQRSEPYKLKTKEIIIKSEKDHDVITLKGVDIYYKKFKLASVSNFEITTDKKQNYVETNTPEIGSIGGFGPYIGPGFVFRTPYSSTLKVIPLLTAGDGKIGVGAILRHRSKRNWVEAAYSSATTDLIVRGTYNFNDNFKLEYGRHGYMEDGFFGSNRPGYLLQLTFEDAWKISDLDATFKQRISGGYVSDYVEKNQEDHNNGTMRLRWMGELYKNIFEIGNREQEMFIRTDAVAQAAATVYGTGDTTGLFRIGPSISSRVKGWGSRIYFTVGGIHGHSPYLFDDYRYGKVSITIDENFRLGKYFAVGYRGTFTPLKDNNENKLVTENKFYFMVGPQDVKAAISWDSVREIAALDFIFLVGSDNAKIKYDKLTIKDPEQIGKERTLFEDWKYRKVKVPEAL